MAYRTFRNELTYDPPEIDFFPKTLAILQTAAQNRVNQQQRNKQLAATYKADDLASQFTTDQQELNLLSADITNKAIADLRDHGYLTPETVQAKSRAIGYKQLSDAQWLRFQQAKQLIADKKFAGPDQTKSYLDKDKEYANLVDHVYGKDDEPVNFNNRGKRLDDWYASQGKVDITSVNAGAFLEDFANQHKNSIQKTTIDPLTGNANTESLSAPFLNKNGIKEVTLDHAKELITSTNDIGDYYRQKAALEILDDERNGIKSKLTPAERQLQIAKLDLEQKQDQIIKNSVRFAPTKAKNNGGYSLGNNENIVSSDTDFSGTTASSGGPGQIILKKNGGQPEISVDGDNMIDLANGNTRQMRPGAKKVNISGIQLVPVTSSGQMIPLKGNTTDEFIQELKNMPDKMFNPNEKGALTDLNIGIRGSYLDKGKILSMAMEKQKSINQEIAEASKNKDADEVIRLTELQAKLEKLRQYTGRDDLDDDQQTEYQALQSLLGLGDTQNDVLIKALPQDLNSIKGLTQGYNPKDTSKWSPDMIRFKQAFDARKATAKANNYGYKETPLKKNVNPANFKQQMSPAGTANAKIGDKKTLSSGTKVKWDGSKWVYDE